MYPRRRPDRSALYAGETGEAGAQKHRLEEMQVGGVASVLRPHLELHHLLPVCNHHSVPSAESATVLANPGHPSGSTRLNHLSCMMGSWTFRRSVLDFICLIAPALLHRLSLKHPKRYLPNPINLTNCHEQVPFWKWNGEYFKQTDRPTYSTEDEATEGADGQGFNPWQFPSIHDSL